MKWFVTGMLSSIMFLTACSNTETIEKAISDVVEDIATGIIKDFAAGLFEAPHQEEASERLKGKVDFVTDGDTFRAVVNGYGDESITIRPILVNAPEICHNNSPKDCEPEPYGPEATDFARDVLLGETVYLVADKNETDPFGRYLFYVFLEDGRMYQEMLLEKGLAEVAVYDDVLYLERLRTVENKAKKNQVGIWANEGEL